ncbi:MAG: chromate transporter [Ruminococcaceae bacterium]|jgi:chromate transporter|nr:chromate transporter [Oscillospiraceae bacterium]
MRSLRSLFFRSLLISAVTVGGGFVILSALRSYYTVRKRLISDEDMDEIAVTAQSAPGAMAINASLLVGYRIRGIPGALVSVLGALIPPVAVMSALAAVSGAVREIPALSGMMTGMRAGAAAVILDTALDFARSALSRPSPGTAAQKTEISEKSPRRSPFRIIVFAAALALCLFTGISPAWILLASGAVGIVGGGVCVLRERTTQGRKRSGADSPSEERAA